MLEVWNVKLEAATIEIEAIKGLLEELAEQGLAELLGYEPIISVLVSSCNFLIANMELIRTRLE